MPERVVLAYSGGLDTSVAVRWLMENEGVEVVAVAVDVGQAAEKGGEDWDAIRARALAADDSVVLHCLPAHRGEEISASVLEGPRSVVWRQAAHRRTAMRGVLAWAVGGGGGGDGAGAGKGTGTRGGFA